MMKKVLAAAFLLVLAGLAVWNFTGQKEAEIGIEKGDKAPDFTLPSLKNGNDVSLSDFKGKKVLLNFWATWCSRVKPKCLQWKSFKMKIRTLPF